MCFFPKTLQPAAWAQTPDISVLALWHQTREALLGSNFCKMKQIISNVRQMLEQNSQPQGVRDSRGLANHSTHIQTTFL